MRRWSLGAALFVLIIQISAAQTLRNALEDAEVGDHWIYNDLDAGIARAKAESKPLFVVFRCVP